MPTEAPESGPGLLTMTAARLKLVRPGSASEISAKRRTWKVWDRSVCGIELKQCTIRKDCRASVADDMLGTFRLPLSLFQDGYRKPWTLDMLNLLLIFVPAAILLKY